ncbi:2-keto-3-deoxy-D-arabino-heptulosonate-7-phosphate synthase II [hydrothermal vent metagenome]|uniref:3-deoxy-7-phosphoheptulonate synthase n=1 Tax=hydrothermal vent metagenome TaxID=652676 RepID=A0A3B0RMF3_9ZZZZ
MSTWTPDSWKQFTVSQQPVYPDPAELELVLKELSNLPPLVTSWEVESLKGHLAACARGDMFLLQGGDCAESFHSCHPKPITALLKIMLQMSLVLTHGTRRRVVRVGRIAGQYAKPRSADQEQRGDEILPTYRGDLFNRSGFTQGDRTPDPSLLLRGYERAALTLNFIRGLIDGGFADLHHPEYWDLAFVDESPMKAEYKRLVANIQDSVEFMEHVLGASADTMRRVEFFTSHEGLSLNYEQAQTQMVPRRSGYYNLSTHFPWIGMRTAQADGAHVEYFRGIRNPIGVKVGPTMTDETLERLLEVLHPDDEPGRLTLIHRFGSGNVRDHLPRLIDVVKRSGKTVNWTVDAMHGNTETTADGIKTRRFENVLSEIRDSFAVHAEENSILGGVHFELTGENVTECLGGARQLSEQDLHRSYVSKCDPRLNYEQALEMAMLVAHQLREEA